MSRAIACLLLILSLMVPSVAGARTLTIVVHVSQGQFAANMGLVSTYMRRHMPALDSVVIQVVPGANGLVAANYLYNVAPRDGYTIGTFTKVVPLRAVLGDKNAKYDPREFTWIGSAGDGRDDPNVLVSRKPYGGGPLNVAEQEAGDASITDTVRNATKWDLRKIVGYSNMAEIKLALLRGEVDATFINYRSLMASNPELEGNIIMQFGQGLTRHRDIPWVRTVAETITDPEQSRMFRAFELSFIIPRPLVAPPGIPPEQAAVLRRAFQDTMEDPDFIREATKLSMNTTYVDYIEAKSVVDRLYNIDRGILTRLQGSRHP